MHDVSAPLTPAEVEALPHDLLLVALGLRGVIPHPPLNNDSNLRQQLMKVRKEKAFAVVSSPSGVEAMPAGSAPFSQKTPKVSPPGPDAYIKPVSRAVYPLPLDAAYTKVIILETDPVLSVRLNDSSWKVYESFLGQLKEVHGKDSDMEDSQSLVSTNSGT